jgi:ABC-type Fe3+/spermidine/putrescine transport system ATPase subunit
VRALDRVSLAIADRELVAVLGPSGCGKSTLLRLLGGLLIPTSGRVAVRGVDPAELSRRHRIGIVFQDHGLLPWRSTRANVGEAELLARYLRAVIKGWELNRRDLVAGAKKTFDLYGTDNSLDLAQQTEENKRQMPLMQSPLTAAKGLFQMSLEDIAGPQYEALRRAGVGPLPDVTSFVTLDVLSSAYGGRTSLLG